MTETYDPIQFWKKEGKDYYKNFEYNEQFAIQEDKLIQLLDTLEFKSVLELGCGFGRITGFISGCYRLDKYTAIDISPDQIKTAREICPSNIEFICTDILGYEPKQKFDLVVAVEVLMHQLPSQIHDIIDKMIMWSNKHVVNLDYFANEELADYNFSHDYLELYHYNVTEIRIGNNNK